MRQNLVVVQQYLSWKGHYKQYFENLLDKEFNYLYVSDKQGDYEGGTWIKSGLDAEKNLTIRSKIKVRFLNSYLAYKSLSSSKYEAVHLMEFEPLNYLIFENQFRRRQMLITIHSSDRLHFSSWINNKISGLQRWLLDIALRKAVKHGAQIVTHYECHKQSLLKVVGQGFSDQISVIHYPAPNPETDQIKKLNGSGVPTFLIYGQIREDKGIYEFLTNEATRNLRITIAGKIIDRRILEFSDKENVTIIDKFLTDEEISDLVERNDFMLLPYPVQYTNGAGTFKDSLAKAMPVVCSNISIFTEIVNDHNVGLIFDKPEDIQRIVQNITAADYAVLSQNCLRYAKKYDWKYMRESYFSLYEKL